MWRFPPKDFASVWGEVEQEEERRRKEAELEEFGDYSGALGKAAAVCARTSPPMIRWGRRGALPMASQVKSFSCSVGKTSLHLI